MFIKIFCGDTEQFFILQSNDAFLDKTVRKINSTDFVLLCRFIDEMSKPVSEQNIDKLLLINETFLNRPGDNKNISEFFCDLIPNTPYDVVAPVLSSEQEVDVYHNESFESKASVVVGEVNLNSVFVGDKYYITTGNIFIMNDDGKTIDRV